jgi:uncharacterized protein Veg
VCLGVFSQNGVAEHKIKYLWHFFGQNVPMTVEHGRKSWQRFTGFLAEVLQ